MLFKIIFLKVIERFHIIRVFHNVDKVCCMYGTDSSEYVSDSCLACSMTSSFYYMHNNYLRYFHHLYYYEFESGFKGFEAERCLQASRDNTPLSNRISINFASILGLICI